MNGSEIMSKERVLKTLEEFEISKADATLYVYLAKKGPKETAELAKSLNTTKQKLYPILRNLEKKGLIMANEKHITIFSALPFDKAIDSLMHVKMVKAKEINNKKIELLALWESIEAEKENKILKRV